MMEMGRPKVIQKLLKTMLEKVVLHEIWPSLTNAQPSGKDMQKGASTSELLLEVVVSSS